MFQWSDPDKLKVSQTSGVTHQRSNMKQQLSTLQFLLLFCVSCCVHSSSLALALGVLAVVPPYLSASSLVFPFLLALLPLLALFALLVLLVAFVSLLYSDVHIVLLVCLSVGSGERSDRQKEKQHKTRESKGRRQNNRTAKKQRRKKQHSRAAKKQKAQQQRSKKQSRT